MFKKLSIQSTVYTSYSGNASNYVLSEKTI